MSVLRSGFANIYLFGLVFAAACCLGAPFFWGFDLFTHGTPYWFLAAVAGVLIFVGLKSWRRALGATAVLLFFALGLVPYYFASASAAATEAPTHKLRVVHFNLLTSNREFEQIETFLRAQRGDVVVLQEFSPKLRTALKSFTQSFPYREIQVRRGAFGIALLSRYPISDVNWHPDAVAEIPVVAATLDVNGSPLRVVAAHPYPPVGQSRALRRNTLLKEIGAQAAGDGPRILVGDLNCTPWSPHFRDLCRSADLRDSARGQGMTPTWFPSFLPIGIPIDHVLVSEEIGITGRSVGPSLGSDHRPLVVDLTF
jgi:endonuclease/exonuclease/phosphatase (EEP) superfamily protein YafD